MRRLLALGALATATACAAVTGLSDYDVVADAVEGGAPDVSPAPTPTGTSVTPPVTKDAGVEASGGRDAEAGVDAADASVVVVDANADADAGPPAPACAAGTVCDVITSSNVVDVAIEGNALFWVETTGATASIRTRALDTTAVTTLVANEPSVAGLAVNAQTIYWTANGVLRRVARAGGTPSSGQNVRGGCLQWGITRLFAAEPSTGHVWSFNENGLDKTGRVFNAAEPWGVTVSVDGASIFYTNHESTTGRIRLVTDNPTNPTIVSGEEGPRCMETDGTKLYWANHDSGELRSSGMGGGNVQTEVAGQTLIHGLALSPSGELYWSWAGGIRKRAK